VAQSCSFCDHPATHRFAVSYRGQVLTGAICEEHGNVVARERLGIRDHRRNLGMTKIGRALTDPNSKPRFQLILHSEHLEIVGETREASVSPSSRSGFSTRRLRSMSRARRSGYRGSRGNPDPVDVELFRVADTAEPGRAAVDHSQTRITSITPLISEQQSSEDGCLHHTEGDPSRVKIIHAMNALDKYAIPLEIGEKGADRLLREHGEAVVRAALRAAIKERRAIA
jgi:hypothetical protein